MALPLRRTNLATNPSFEAAGTPVTLATNLLLNPLGRIAGNIDVGTNCTATYGAGGAVLLHTNGVGAGNCYIAPQFAMTSGVTYYARAVVTDVTGTPSSKAAVHGNIGGVQGTEATMTRVGNTLFREWSFVATFTGTGRLLLDVIGVGTGESFRLTEMIVSTTPLEGFFDGATAAADDLTYSWTGTANASTSQRKHATVAGAAGTVNTRAMQSTVWKNRGSFSLRLKALNAAADTYASPGGDTGAMRLGLLPGRTYTFTATSYIPSGTALLNRNIRAYYKNPATGAGYATVTSPQVALDANFERTQTVTMSIPADATEAFVRLYNGEAAGSGGDVWWDELLVEEAAATASYFDGDSTTEGWIAEWNGTPHASTSYIDATGLWVDPVTDGTAHARITVLGLGMTPSTTKITRNDGRQNWPVPGWLGRNTVDADTGIDSAVPLGRPVTYTLWKNGIAVASRTVTVDATQGDIMDPLNPGGAVRVATASGDPSVLVLGAEALREATYANTQSDREHPLGARHAISRPGVRGAVQSVPVVLNAHTNAASDALLHLVEEAPIVLIRPLPSWGSLPSLIYTDGDAQEAPFNRGRGGQFTQWVINADAVAPMTRAASYGRITHAEVKDNLVGRTHASIKASSGSKRHVEIKANPLGLGQ